MKRLTALIVEDDSFWQERYQKILELRGIEWVSAQSLDEALGEIKRQRFALAIVDMNLTRGTPLDDGLRVLADIRERGDDTAIVVSTGYPTIDLAVAGYEKYHIKKFLEKRKWTAEEFDRIISAVLLERPSFTPQFTLTSRFNFEELGAYWYTHENNMRELLKNASLEIEPLVPETLTSVKTLETPKGEILQIFAWSRGLGAPLAFRLGKLDTIKSESASYNDHKVILSKLRRPLRKVSSPYYGVHLGVLLIEPIGIAFGPVSLLGTLFRDRNYERFLIGLRDLLNVSCADLYQSQSRSELTTNLVNTFDKHLAELAQRRQDRLAQDEQAISQALQQMDIGERSAEEYQYALNEEERRKNWIAAGFPTRNGNLADAIDLLREFRGNVEVTQTLVSQQLSINNVYVDRDNISWPIFGGRLKTDSPAIELAGLETELKFSVLAPSPVGVYISLERILDSVDSPIEVLDEPTRTISEAIRLIRLFAKNWQPDDRFYRFMLAIQALRIAETTRIPSQRDGALFSATWQAEKILE
jgi:ActR/RegA family two-component response regulator